jgi:nitrous oxidase accessory protein NosD
MCALLGVNDAVVEHNVVSDNGEDAVLGALLERPRIRFNGLRRSGRGAGLVFSRDLQVVANEMRDNRAEGIGVEESVHAVVRDNVLTGNAGGIAALDLPGGRPLSDVTISSNDISRNNLVYEGEFGVSGLGLLVLGASHVVVQGNRIWNNTAHAAKAVSGGIRIMSARRLGGTDPRDVVVRNNIVTRNSPQDVWWDRTGMGIRFVGNTCRRSIPRLVCSG